MADRGSSRGRGDYGVISHRGSAALPGWITEERLRLYPRALLLALLAALVLPVLLAEGARTVGGTLGGDYAAFHAAGRLVLEGRVAELYDWSAQAAAQAGLHPSEPGRFLAFAYPPFVALPYAALATLGFRAAYAVHTAAAVGALVAAVALTVPRLRRLGAYPALLLAIAAGFLPLFRAVAGGQNTPFTLLVLAAAWALLSTGREVAAGAVAALLLAKPQFGLPLLGLLALRHPRALLGAAGTALALYALGAMLGGVGWVGWWWGQIATFHAMDQGVNAANSVGVLGWLEAWLGPGHPAALGLGGLVSAALALGLAVVWRSPLDARTRWGLTAVGLVLIPPHSMSYDAGLAALALWVWADRTAEGAGTPLGPLTAWLAAGLAPLASVLGVSPLLPVVVAAGAGVWLTRPRPAGP